MALRALALAGTVVLASAGTAAAQTTVTTEPATGLLLQGNTFGLTFGQRFRTPNAFDTVLSLLRLSIRTENPALFVGRLTAWDPIGMHPTGPVLFTSPAGVTSTAPDPVYLTFLFPGGVPLTAGTDYAFFLSIASGAGAVSTFIAGNPYPDGGRFQTQSADLTTVLTTTANVSSADLGFTAQFDPIRPSVVPEPASMLLLGTGLASLAAAARRRRRRAEPE
jgi:hypothetical protein